MNSAESETYIDRCPKCAGELKVVITGILGEWLCEDCNYSELSVGSFIIPESPDTDRRDGVLIMKLPGTSRVETANMIRQISGISAREALELAKSGNHEIARRPSYEIPQLEEFQLQLEQIGATAQTERRD